MLLSILLTSANSSLLIAIILRKMVTLPNNHTNIIALTGLYDDNYEALIFSFDKEYGKETCSSCTRRKCAFKR